MRNNALYFPYISLPKEEWTIKTLLYWDKLSSIVPMDHIDAPEQLTPFMRKLVSNDLVDQVFPGPLLHKVESFEQSFIRFLKPKVEFYRSHPLRPFSVAGRRNRVHVEKLGKIGVREQYSLILETIVL